MTDGLQVIEQREVLGKEFRIYGDTENPLFLAKDIAMWIEHSNSRAMLESVDDFEKVVRTVYTPGGNQAAWFLTEDGLYEVLLQSRKPIAREFKLAVKEVLRSIRKHGAYMTPEKIEEALLNPDTIIQLATALKEERAKNAGLLAESTEQKRMIDELKPMADYVNYILSSPGTVTSGQIAADYGLSAYKLNKILEEERFHRKVNDQWLLYREHLGNGYTKSETIPIERSDGRPDTKMFTKWTQRGRLKINEVLNGRGIYAEMDKADAKAAQTQERREQASA